MGRILDRVIGHRQIIQRLIETKQQNKVPGTLLFVGPEGVGRRLTAMGFAQALLCENDPSGCGVCGSCIRVEKGTSEGVLLVEPEKQQIRIERSREILEFLNLQAITNFRVIIIDAAESLNLQAANALLKVLEEPPPRTVFILVAPTPKHVLQTIRSRSMIVSFAALDPMEMGVKAPAWALSASGGSFSKLAKLMDESELEERTALLEMLKWWLEDETSYLRPSFRERVKDREFAHSCARGFQAFFRDLELHRFGLGSALQYADQKELLSSFAAVLPDGKAQSLYQMSLGLESELKANRDSQLLFEEFWIRSHAI